MTADALGPLLGDDDTSGPAPTEFTYAPAVYALQGRAQGLAAGLGAAPGAVSLALALAWDPHGGAAHALAALGVERRDLVNALRNHGMRVPERLPPRAPAVDWGVPVPFPRPRSGLVVSDVRAHLAPDVPVRFGYERDHAWVRTVAALVLLELVAAAVTRWRQ